MAYEAAPLFAPLSADELANAAAGRAGRGGGGGGGAPQPPAAAAPTPAAVPAPWLPPLRRWSQAAAGAGVGGPPVPATARQTRLDPQERYDNLVFPRGGGPGVLAGRAGGPPNPAAGAPLFTQQCASCHRFGTIGASASYGPDLTTIGKTMARRDILRAIFFPDEKVDPKNRATVLTLRDNSTVRGLVVSETAQSLVVKTAGAAEPVTVQKTQVASRRTDNTSIMLNQSSRHRRRSKHRPRRRLS